MFNFKERTVFALPKSVGPMILAALMRFGPVTAETKSSSTVSLSFYGFFYNFFLQAFQQAIS